MLWPKLENVSTMVFYKFIAVSKCLEGSIFFARKSVLPKRQVLTLKQQILP